MKSSSRLIIDRMVLVAAFGKLSNAATFGDLVKCVSKVSKRVQLTIDYIERAL